MVDPDTVSIRSDASVKSVNMYGSPVPDNVDAWRLKTIFVQNLEV